MARRPSTREAALGCKFNGVKRPCPPSSEANLLERSPSMPTRPDHTIIEVLVTLKKFPEIKSPCSVDIRLRFMSCQLDKQRLLLEARTSDWLFPFRPLDGLSCADASQSGRVELL